jgi:hypothetical protein
MMEVLTILTSIITAPLTYANYYMSTKKRGKKRDSRELASPSRYHVRMKQAGTERNRPLQTQICQSPVLGPPEV